MNNSDLTTSRLALPQLAPAQALKYITHNEALRRLDCLVHLSVIERDRNIPPENPSEGECYIIGAEPTGIWTEKVSTLAIFNNNQWTYLEPKIGFRAYIADSGQSVTFDGTAWTDHNTAVPYNQLGINAEANESHRLVVSSDTTLLTHEGSNHRLVVNKAAEPDTASVVLQSDYVGHAEIGLTSNLDFSVKVSPDGMLWHTPLKFSANGDIIYFNANIASDRRLAHPSNTAFGIGALDSPNLEHTESLEGWRNTAIGFDALSNAQTANNNTACGYRALAETTTGRFNVGIGTSALAVNTDGDANLAAGYLALGSATTANFNTGLGYAALAATTTGGDNTSVGAFALYSTTSGIQNTGLGGHALRLNNTGSHNVAIGSGALYANKTSNGSTAIGTNALRKNTGSGNVAVGYGAAYENSNGRDNIAIGRNSMRFTQSGHSNTAVGLDALSYKVNGEQQINYSNCTGIGAGARVSGSNQVQLGNSQTNVYAYGAVQQRSDRRDKCDISSTALGLDFILGLQPVDFKYDYRDDYPGIPDGKKRRTRKHHGFIAQDVDALCKSLEVDFAGLQHHAKSGMGSDVYTLGYCEFIGPLVAAIQALHMRLDHLEHATKT